MSMSKFEKLSDGMISPHRFKIFSDAVKDMFKRQGLHRFLEATAENEFENRIPELKFCLETTVPVRVRAPDGTNVIVQKALVGGKDHWMTEAEELIVLTDPVQYSRELELVRVAKRDNDKAEKTFRDDRTKAIQLLTSCLSEALSTSLQTEFGTENVFLVWNAIKQRCGPKSEHDGELALDDEWTNIVRLKDETIAALLQRIDDMAKSYVTYGVRKSDPVKRATFRKAVRFDMNFDSFWKPHCERAEDVDRSWDEFKLKTLQAEGREQADVERKKSYTPAKQYVNVMAEGAADPPPEKTVPARVQSREATQKCWGCGEIGHIRRECPHQSAQKAEAKPAPAAATMATMRSTAAEHWACDPSESLCAVDIGPKEQKDTIFDSGATAHCADLSENAMAGYESRLERVRTAAKGTTMVSHGRGQVGRLEDVMRIDNLLHNTVSVGQLDDRGCYVVMGGGRCLVLPEESTEHLKSIIKSEENKALMSGTLQNGLYRMDEQLTEWAARSASGHGERGIGEGEADTACVGGGVGSGRYDQRCPLSPRGSDLQPARLHNDAQRKTTAELVISTAQPEETVRVQGHEADVYPQEIEEEPDEEGEVEHRAHEAPGDITDTSTMEEPEPLEPQEEQERNDQPLPEAAPQDQEDPAEPENYDRGIERAEENEDLAAAREEGLERGHAAREAATVAARKGPDKTPDEEIRDDRRASHPAGKDKTIHGIVKGPVPVVLRDDPP